MSLKTIYDFVALVMAQEDSNNESIMVNGLLSTEVEAFKKALNTAFAGEFVVRMISTGRAEANYDPAAAAPGLPEGTKIAIYQYRVKFVNGQSVYFKGWLPQDDTQLEALRVALAAEAASAFTAGSEVESVIYEKKSKY